MSGTPESPLWAGDNTQYKFDVSRTTDLAVNLYIRNPNAAPNAGRSQDIFIGKVNITPRFEEVRAHNEDGKANKKEKNGTEQDKSLGQSGSEWLDVDHGTGNIKIGVEFVENRQKSLAIDDFELLKVVGKGSFGKVMQVQYVYRKPQSLPGLI